MQKHPHIPFQPMCVEMERIHSAETVSCDGGDKTLSRKQGRSAKPPGRETPREDNPTSCEDEKVTFENTTN